MNRYFYLCNNLEDVAYAEEQLLVAGFSSLQMHVLSNDDASAEKYHLHDVDSLSKKDIIRSSLVGALLGAVCAGLIVVIAMVMGVSGEAWAPVIFLAVFVLGFCTWEGGLFGIQTNHHDFARFEPMLNEGKHVFFADVDEPQRVPFFQVLSNFPSMRNAGSGKAEASWKLSLREGARRFVHWAP